MTKKAEIKKRQTYTMTPLFYKEVLFSVLAVISILLLGYEFFYSPSASMVRAISQIDFFIALLFLTDFCWQLFISKNKQKFIKHNWYLLLASVPLIDSWAEALRGLRILSLVRLIRASEHITYATKDIKPNRHINK